MSSKKEKPLSAKDKALIEKQKALEAEEEAHRAAEEERLKHIEETRAAAEEEFQEIAEQTLRIEQLMESNKIIESYQRFAKRIRIKEKTIDEWERYLKCDGLPNPSNVSQVNTYLHLWDKIIDKTEFVEAVRRTDEIIKLLDDLDDFIDDPRDSKDLELEADWKWIRSEFREHQQRSLDVASYELLRDICKKLVRLEIPTSEFRLKENNVALCLWAKIQLPKPTPNPRTPQRPRIELSFPEMSLKVTFPQSVQCQAMAVRAMYINYDHLSDNCSSFVPPATPPVYEEELLEIVRNEWFQKMCYKYKHRIITKPARLELVLEDGSMTYVDPPAEVEVKQGEMPPHVPYQRLDPTPNDYVIQLEDDALMEALTRLKTQHPPDVVNMRKYMIIGGVYHFNLFYQPSQPQEFVLHQITYAAFLEPGSLSDVPYYVQYIAPPQPEAGVRRLPEEIEEEIKLQEFEYDKLMLFTITLPMHVLWLDVPIVCYWEAASKEWNSGDVHDMKHIEEKGYITFRSGKFGPFAIATLKYTNLPFQAWDLRPEEDGSVTLQLTCAILMLELNVKGNLIAISQLQNSPGEALDAFVGIYYTLPALKRMLRTRGVDVFPAMDTFHYVSGSCEKHWPMERHLYQQMSQSATVYQYTWSRWNISAGKRAALMQMRQYLFNKPKQKHFNMLMVTPLKALLIDCTEVSQAFVKKGVDGTKFYADLNQLMQGITTKATKKRLSHVPKELINTLAELLMSTRFLSYS